MIICRVLLLLNTLQFVLSCLQLKLAWCTFVGFGGYVSPTLKEVTYPQCGRHIPIYSDHLCFSRASRVKPLSFYQAINHASVKCCVGASVTSHIVINSKHCVYGPMILVQIHSLDCQT